MIYSRKKDERDDQAAMTCSISIHIKWWYPDALEKGVTSWSYWTFSLADWTAARGLTTCSSPEELQGQTGKTIFYNYQ